MSLIANASAGGIIAYKGASLRFGSATGYGAAGYSEQMRLDSSGNLGIGTTSPGTYGKLVVSGSAASAGVESWIQNQTDTGGDNTRYAGLNFSVGSDTSTAAIRVYRTNSATNYENAMVFYTKGTGASPTVPTERMRLDSAGRLLVGKTSGVSTVDVVDTGSGGVRVTSGTTDLRLLCGASAAYLYNASAVPTIFTINTSEAMRLDASSNLLVGTTATTGDATNSKQIVGGIYSTVSGSVSAANATATTLFTTPSTVSAWMVTVNISAASVTLYAATYLINTQGGSSTVATLLYKGTNMLITMSGYAVQVTQTSGVTQTVSYSAMRIA